MANIGYKVGDYVEAINHPDKHPPEPLVVGEIVRVKAIIYDNNLVYVTNHDSHFTASRFERTFKAIVYEASLKEKELKQEDGRT